MLIIKSLPILPYQYLTTIETIYPFYHKLAVSPFYKRLTQIPSFFNLQLQANFEHPIPVSSFHHSIPPRVRPFVRSLNFLLESGKYG
jgi:hypothetical protein